MTSSELPPDDSLEGTYVLDAESAVEMARLIDLDRIMTDCMGGLLPEQDEAEIQQMRMILDIACGPGAWVRDLARTYPQIQVTGIDTSHRFIRYAREQTATEGLHNAQFRKMNALKSLQFPDDSFDLVNMRLAAGFVPSGHWPLLIKECQRVLRPGGTLRLTEVELSLSNMPNVEAMLSALGQALYRAGRGSSPSGKYLGIITMLSSLLKQAGLQNVRNKANVVDSSYNMPAHESAFNDAKRTFLLIKPLIEATSVMPEYEYDLLYEEAMQEMQRENFCSISFLLTAWGKKRA